MDLLLLAQLLTYIAIVFGIIGAAAWIWAVLTTPLDGKPEITDVEEV